MFYIHEKDSGDKLGHRAKWQRPILIYISSCWNDFNILVGLSLLFFFNVLLSKQYLSIKVILFYFKNIKTEVNYFGKKLLLLQ